MISFYNYTAIISLICAIIGLWYFHQPIIVLFSLLLCSLFTIFDRKNNLKLTKNKKRLKVQINYFRDIICFGLLPISIGYSLNIKFKAFIVVSIIYFISTVIKTLYGNVKGLPLISVALVVAILFLLKPYFIHKIFLSTYATILVFMAILFLAPIKIKKIKLSLKIILTLLNIALTVILYWQYKGYF